MLRRSENLSAFQKAPEFRKRRLHFRDENAKSEPEFSFIARVFGKTATLKSVTAF
jgi:hypothetical protein